MLLQDFIEWTSLEGFISWWESLGASEQLILGIFGIIIAVAVTVLVCIGVFYLLKYLFIGLGYMFMYIFKGFAWIFKQLGELFALIFGMEKTETQETEQSQQVSTEETQPIQKTIVLVPQKTEPIPESQDSSKMSYCTECGMKFTDLTSQKLVKNGVAFCVYCGTGFKPEIVPLQTISLTNQKDYSNYR